MKFMLMMHAPRGNGDYSINQWKPEEFRAHIQFMKDLNKELRDAGELVGAEGLAPPGQARIVRQGRRRSRSHGRALRRVQGVPRGLLDCRRRERRARVRHRRQGVDRPGPGGKPLGIKIEVRQVMSAPPDSL